MSELFVDAAGSGEHVIFVHGSLATGREEWEAQQPLAEEGFRLLVVDRRGYGRSPGAEGEDFLRDAQDIAALMDTGAHLVGHSYGGLAAMFAAALRPGQTRSLALLEPPAFTLGQDRPAARHLVAKSVEILDLDLPDRTWLVRFLESVGSRPEELPPGLLDAALPLVPLLRNARRPTDAELPIAELSSAPYPSLVVSGGHHPGFEEICDDLAEKIGASRSVIEGAGHEVQFTGAPINDALLALWRSASAR
ncbi:alpha/beta fold hydrolase [Pseudactinotalea sp. Z1732]|uniref:alpha/beta fold hydrolase n=1 Tax=Micrococcales TaxID=85006 RepID=UPI003C7A1C09